jgi:hypothetical protein
MGKICFKCGSEKPFDEFYRHPGMADGRLGKCKSCVKTDVAANYRKNREYYAEYERQRFQNSERKIALRRYAKQRRQRQPEKYRAAVATSNAIRDGRLVKQPCEQCGAQIVEAHHEDYSKPLDVKWLCRKHHLERHGKIAF